MKEDFSQDPTAQHLVQEQRVLAMLRYTRETLSKECNSNGNSNTRHFIGGDVRSTPSRNIMEGNRNKRNYSQFNPSPTTTTAIHLTTTNASSNLNSVRQVQQRTDVGQSYTQTFHPPPAIHNRNIPISTSSASTSIHNNGTNSYAHNNILSSSSHIPIPTHTNAFNNTISDNIWDEEVPYNENNANETIMQPPGTILTQADVRRAFRDVNRSVHNFHNNNTTTANNNSVNSNTQAMYGTTTQNPTTSTEHSNTISMHRTNHSRDSLNSDTSNYSHSSHRSINSTESNTKIAELFNLTQVSTKNTQPNRATAKNQVNTTYDLTSTELLSTQPVTQFVNNATLFTAPPLHQRTQHGINTNANTNNNASILLSTTQVNTATRTTNIFTQMSQAGKKMTFAALLDD